MSGIQLFVGLGAIAVTVYIAIRQYGQLRGQEAQLRKLQEIGIDTKEIGIDTRNIARHLKTDEYTHNAMSSFFSFDQNPNRKYKCVFPVCYEKRPLPLIMAGDYNALHVLQNLVEAERIKLEPVPMMTDGSATPPPQKLLRGDAIYICSPRANPALDQLAPAVNLAKPLEDTDDPEFVRVKLPCWFANDSRSLPQDQGASSGRPSKKVWIPKNIWIPELKLPLQSGAEDDYKRADGLEHGEVFESHRNPQTDYAILLRLTQAERTVVVLAGIHQYGTWIAGHFFCRLATDSKLEYRDVFLGHEDFVAILYGEFDHGTFTVKQSEVMMDYVWVRQHDGDGWDRQVHGAQTAVRE